MKEMQTSRAPTSLYSPARLPLSKICNSDAASINAFRDKWPGVNPPLTHQLFHSLSKWPI